MRSRFVALLLTAVLFPYAGGCSSRPPAATPPASTPPAATAFGGTDLAWIEISIAMNDQLQPLLRLVPEHTRDAAMTGLCARLQSAVVTETATLHRLHDRAGLPAQNPHEGMTMPGLIPADAVTRAAALSGPSFDAALAAQLKPYLQQSRRLAEDERRAGTDPETRALATTTAATRAGALQGWPA